MGSLHGRKGRGTGKNKLLPKYTGTHTSGRQLPLRQIKASRFGAGILSG